MRHCLTLFASVLLVVAGVGCQQTPKPAPKVAHKPLPLKTISDGIQKELNQMQKIYDLRGKSGAMLASMNRKLQSRGFSRRIPSGPATQALDSDLRAHATGVGLRVQSLSTHTPKVAPLPKNGVTLPPTQRWKLSPDDVSAEVTAEITLVGPRPLIERFIDDLPKRVERAVLVTGHRRYAGGAVLLVKAFYERHHPAPKLDLRWPSLEKRLQAAGYPEETEAMRRSPAWADLKERDTKGRARIPSLRTMMLVAHDFPRWFAKAALFNRVSRDIMAVKGKALLSQPPSPNKPG